MKIFTNKPKIILQQNPTMTISLFECKFPLVSLPNEASIPHLVKKFCEEDIVKNLLRQQYHHILTAIKMSGIKMKFS